MGNIEQLSYQVGGSLANDAPTYIEREADRHLYNCLKRGDFCYILNARQMGKSSLLVKTRHRLETLGFKCTSVDMTRIGGENITPLQWYKGIVTELWQGFRLLGKFNLKSWWREAEDISLLQRLSYFVELLLEQFPEDRLFIFIDEIDSILSLDFPVDDFFAWIRFCYNQRAIAPEYQRLNFAIFGVATPSDLIRDRQRTPFNIGEAIALDGFTVEEAAPLARGFGVSDDKAIKILNQILSWTGGQPFLTQKLCQLATVELSKISLLFRQDLDRFIDDLVRQAIVENWESQDEPEHLRTIRDRCLADENRAGRLLGLYQTLLHHTPVPVDDSREQMELLLSGLAVKDSGQLRVRNPIYRQVFDLDWVAQQLNQLRPYSQTFNAWLRSGKTDESRLLRGQALLDAQQWSMGKSLSNLDYQFLAASQHSDRRAVQQALEAEKLVEVEARLAQEQKTAQLQRSLLATAVAALVVSLGFGGTAYWQYRQARLREIDALTSSSQGLFASDRRLDALIQAMKAWQAVRQLGAIAAPLQTQVSAALNQSFYGATEYNRLSQNETRVWDIAFTRDGQRIATITQDNTIRIWDNRGQLLHEIEQPGYELRSLAFSPDGQTLATATSIGEVELLNTEGRVVTRFPAHDLEISQILYSPDAQTVATASGDGLVKLWKTDGTLQHVLSGHRGPVRQIAFSQDGQRIASASNDRTVKLWNRSGKLLKTFEGFDAPVTAVTFTPDGQYSIAGGADRRVERLGIDEGDRLTLGEHEGSIYAIAVSPDGQTIASGGWDKTVKLWSLDGRFLRTFRGHRAPISGLSFSPDGQTLASASFEGEVKLWKLYSDFLQVFRAHQSEVRAIAFTPDSQSFASSSWDGFIHLWRLDGTLLRSIRAHESGIVGLAFSPDGRTLASGSWDETIKLWDRDGNLLKSFHAHSLAVNQVAFSPDGQRLASVGNDNTVKLWKLDGTLVQTFDNYPESATAIAFSPDGQRLVTGSEDYLVRIWHVNGTLLHQFSGHRGGIWGVAFSPDGRWVASASADGTAKLWPLDGGEPISLDRHGGIVDKVVFSPDGELVATASWDRTVKLWNRQGVELKSLARHQEPVRIVQFSPDGRWLVSGGDDRNVVVWDRSRVMALDEFDRACQLVADYLQFSPEIAPRDRKICNDSSDGDRPGTNPK
ncbi:AAA-like domain-containing protein [Oxynema sp. CENA135]|uniref:WD40 domain-containing protein n=1 Tax=Oxynema sp. CENA135 TaxID=984206 RepID=UPI00190BB674|nr:AAA-like domain-containing protein [Oxynema sp. CENA135]MBK4730675.1 AAA-like domain-containing protein [Oxynema sp. CENA135]